MTYLYLFIYLYTTELPAICKQYLFLSRVLGHIALGYKTHIQQFWKVPMWLPSYVVSWSQWSELPTKSFRSTESQADHNCFLWRGFCSVRILLIVRMQRLAFTCEIIKFFETYEWVEHLANYTKLQFNTNFSPLMLTTAPCPRHSPGIHPSPCISFGLCQ